MGKKIKKMISLNLPDVNTEENHGFHSVDDFPELFGPKIIVIGFSGIVCISLKALKLAI